MLVLFNLGSINIANAFLSYGFVLLPIYLEKDFIGKSQKRNRTECRLALHLLVVNIYAFDIPI